MENYGGWYFKVRPARADEGGIMFMAWCARSARLGNGPLDVEPVEATVHWRCDADADTALKALRAQVLN